MTTRRQQPMTATVVETEQGFDVTVEHGNAQSYSRAVYPFAMKRGNAYLRDHPHHGTTALDDVEWSREIDHPDEHPDLPKDRTVSRFHYLTDYKIRAHRAAKEASNA